MIEVMANLDRREIILDIHNFPEDADGKVKNRLLIMAQLLASR